MSYKSRDDEIDEKMYYEFTKSGFDGEQANGKELDEDLLYEPIDIFMMSLKDKESNFKIPKLEGSNQLNTI